MSTGELLEQFQQAFKRGAVFRNHFRKAIQNYNLVQSLDNININVSNYKSDCSVTYVTNYKTLYHCISFILGHHMSLMEGDIKKRRTLKEYMLPRPVKIFRINPLSHYMFPHLKATQITVEGIGMLNATTRERLISKTKVSIYTVNKNIIPYVRAHPFYKINTKFTEALPINYIGDEYDDYSGPECLRYVSLKYHPRVEAVYADNLGQAVFLAGPYTGTRVPIPISMILHKAIIELTWHKVPHHYVSLSKNYLIPSRILNRIGTVNLDHFLGFRPHTLLLLGFEARPTVVANNDFVFNGIEDRHFIASIGAGGEFVSEKLWDIKMTFSYFDPNLAHTGQKPQTYVSMGNVVTPQQASDIMYSSPISPQMIGGHNMFPHFSSGMFLPAAIDGRYLMFPVSVYAWLFEPAIEEDIGQTDVSRKDLFKPIKLDTKTSFYFRA